MSATDPLAVKRKQVYDLMVAADKDSPTLERDLANQPEAVLDELLRHYGTRLIW